MFDQELWRALAVLASFGYKLPLLRTLHFPDLISFTQVPDRVETINSVQPKLVSLSTSNNPLRRAGAEEPGNGAVLG